MAEEKKKYNLILGRDDIPVEKIFFKGNWKQVKVLYDNISLDTIRQEIGIDNLASLYVRIEDEKKEVLTEMKF